MESLKSAQPIELFRYLRTLVDNAETARNPYPKFALVEAYWHIGRIIVEIEQHGQQRADYGIHLIETLSQNLTEAFGKGYSLPNMWKFKQFFLAFPILSTNGRELTNLRQHLRTELCWSHYRILMQLNDLQERAFYIQQAADERWPVKFMQRMIDTRYYHQVALGGQELLPSSPRSTNKSTPQLSPAPTPSAVGGTARTRLATIKKILLERHVGYAFVAQRQFISVAGKDRWAEIVFFHFVLNRFVLVELGEHDPVTTTQFRLLLDGYVAKQPSAVDKLPIGFLVNQAGVVKIQTTSHEPAMPTDEEIILPRQFA